MVSGVCELHRHADYIVDKIEGASGWGGGREKSGYGLECTFVEAVQHCVEMLFDEGEFITEVDQFFLDDADSDEIPMPIMASGLAPTLKERLAALAAYLDDFESPIEFGYWESPSGSLPFHVMSQGAIDFVQTCYDFGWVRLRNWGEWMQSRESTELRDNPTVLAQATPEQLGKLLTVLIRQDRFVEGALAGAYDSGLLTLIVQRAAALAS